MVAVAAYFLLVSAVLINSAPTKNDRTRDEIDELFINQVYDSSLDGEFGEYFEGDMLLTSMQQQAIKKAKIERNGLKDSTKRWPNRTVVYHIVEEDFDEKEIKMIEEAMNDIANKSCLQFRKRENEEHAVMIQGSANGCFSSVGFNTEEHEDGQEGDEERQVLNLSKGCFRHGTVVHEMLHTLGFYHMQSTFDRDDFVEIIWENINPGKEHNFAKYTIDTVTDFDVPYDYGSVMHYPKTAFSKNGNKTIIPLQENVTIGQRHGLSENDILKLNKMYCEKIESDSISYIAGVVASMYGCTPGGPGFKSRVGPSLEIESFCIVSLSHSPELGSWRCLTLVPREHVKPSVLCLNSHWSCRVVVPPEYESDRNRECTCVWNTIMKWEIFIALFAVTSSIAQDLSPKEIEEFSKFLEKTSVIDNAEKDVTVPADDDAWQNSGKFEGDIILDDIQRKQIVAKVGKTSRAVLTDLTFLWPGKKIPYMIRSDQFNKTHDIGKGCFRVGAIAHEIFHALGFLHTQARMDRDEYVKIQWENVNDTRKQNFMKYVDRPLLGGGRDILAYDYYSIMHYSRKAFTKNGLDTILPLKVNPAIIGQRKEIYIGDLININVVYCNDTTTPQPGGSRKRPRKE
ncbi:unnamed protein product, partial [Brenthis ino]